MQNLFEDGKMLEPWSGGLFGHSMVKSSFGKQPSKKDFLSRAFFGSRVRVFIATGESCLQLAFPILTFVGIVSVWHQKKLQVLTSLES